MDDLIAGYHRFRKQRWPERRQVFERLSESGQQPMAMVVACVDSRVDPAMIFDAGPGEMLIVRNVANLVPPYAPDEAYHGTSAALEFGVRVLKVRDLIVLGHGQCGGIQALLHGAPDNARDFVGPWMTMAEEARVAALKEPQGPTRQQCCEYEVIKVSLRNLMTFPWIAERVWTGELRLHGGWFAIHSGELMLLGPDGKFVSVDLSF